MTPGEIARLSGLFDADETMLLWAKADNTSTLIAAARSLGWPMHKLERVRKRVQRKLDRLRTAAPAFQRRLVEDLPGYSNPVYLERLQSGRRCWSTRTLPVSYLAAIIDGMPITETSNFLKSQSSVRNLIRVGSPMQPIESLKKQLTTARTELSRTHEKIHSNFVALTEAEYKLETAQRALAKGAKEVPSSSAAFQGAVAIGQTETAGRRVDLDTTKKEAAVQATKITELEGELAVREFEATREAFAPLSAEVYAAIDALESVCTKVDALLEKTGPADLDEIFFALRQEGGYYPMPKLAKRNARSKAFFAGLSACRIRVEYDGRKELAKVG